MRKVLLLAVILLLATSGISQNPTNPMQRKTIGVGAWWRNPDYANLLKLTQEQIAQLDKSFDEVSAKALDMNAELQKESIRLDSLFRGDSPDKDVMNQAEKVLSLRQQLARAAYTHTLSVRHTLTPDQWKQMLALKAASNYESVPQSQH